MTRKSLLSVVDIFMIKIDKNIAYIFSVPIIYY
jgi:hypothetical protein